MAILNMRTPKTCKTASVLNSIKTNMVKKECYLIRQYNIHFFNKIIFFKYTTRQINAAISIKIIYLLVSVCSFDLSCPVLKNNNFIKYLYIVLSGLIK